MRLTKESKYLIVQQIMDDVPKVDYDEQATALIQADALTKLPILIQRVYDDAELRGFLDTTHICVKWGSAAYEYDYANIVAYREYEPKGDVLKAYTKLKKAEAAQTKARDALRLDVTGVVNSCSTTKALLKALPEFAKYVPKEEEKASNVPALANLMADFVKAGWPKDRGVAA